MTQKVLPIISIFAQIIYKVIMSMEQTKQTKQTKQMEQTEQVERTKPTR